jgi:hypothetical protein
MPTAVQVDSGAVCRQVRAAVRINGLRGVPAGTFDVSTIGLDTDLESLGVDSIIVGALCVRAPSARRTVRARSACSSQCCVLVPCSCLQKYYAAHAAFSRPPSTRLAVCAHASDQRVCAHVAHRHSRLLEIYPLAIDPAAYRELRTPREIASHLQGLADAAPPAATSLHGRPADSSVPAEPTATVDEQSYADTLWGRGLDGVMDRAYKDGWSALWAK